MRKWLIIAAVLCAAAFGAHRWDASREMERAIAERRAALSGYRLEHLEQEHLLFLHHPDGTRDGVDLARLQGVSLGRLNAADASDAKNHYTWVMSGPPIAAVVMPYFAVDPAALLRILKKEHPEIDTVAALRRTREFEHDEFDLCGIWTPPGAAEVRAASGYRLCPPAR